MPTKTAERILCGEYVNLDELLPENLSKQPGEQLQWQASARTSAPPMVSLPDTTLRRKVVDM